MRWRNRFARLSSFNGGAVFFFGTSATTEEVADEFGELPEWAEVVLTPPAPFTLPGLIDSLRSFLIDCLRALA